MTMATLEEAQAQMNYEIAVYREQISMLKRETERISLTTIDLSNALHTVENLSTEKVLVPIGGGALLKAKVTETRVLVPIGAEYMLEMEKDHAAAELNRRIDATRKATEKLNEEFNRIMGKLREVTSQLQQTETQAHISERGEENIKEDYI